MKGLIKKLRGFCHKSWMRIVHVLIACLEADLRGRALDWLYSHVEKDTLQIYHDRYERDGGRYHRESWWRS